MNEPIVKRVPTLRFYQKDKDVDSEEKEFLWHYTLEYNGKLVAVSGEGSETREECVSLANIAKTAFEKVIPGELI